MDNRASTAATTRSRCALLGLGSKERRDFSGFADRFDAGDRRGRPAGMQVAGALTIVRDPASAEVPTLPEAAIRRMKPDPILPLPEIHSVLRKLGEPQ